MLQTMMLPFAYVQKVFRLILYTMLLVGSADFANAVQPLRMCYEDTSVYPWITGDNKGLVITELHLVEEKLGTRFEMVRLPWKRCLSEVQAGKIDAAIAASYSDGRAAWGIYPRNADGALDREARLHTDSFHIYRRLDSTIRWNNGKLENLGEQPVGAQLGYSVGRYLEDAGYSMHYVPASEDLMRMLSNNALQVAVLQNYEALRILQANPALERLVVRDGEPVRVADQYLLFSAAAYARDEPLVKAIWHTMAVARKSKRYLDQEALLIKSKP